MIDDHNYVQPLAEVFFLMLIFIYNLMNGYVKDNHNLSLPNLAIPSFNPRNILVQHLTFHDTELFTASSLLLIGCWLHAITRIL